MVSPSRLKDDESGQALIETVLALPLVLALLFNAVNFGHFFIVAINISAAPRSGALYSIQGASTPSSPILAAPGPTGTVTSVSYLTLQDLHGGIANGGSAQVQVCTQQAGVTGTGATQKSNCTRYNSSPTYTIASDPEASSFVLNRVDVTYSFRPLINHTAFNLILLASSLCNSSSGTMTCTFHRQVSMRSMN